MSEHLLRVIGVPAGGVPCGGAGAGGAGGDGAGGVGAGGGGVGVAPHGLAVLALQYCFGSPMQRYCGPESPDVPL